jgi:hypothetical protein
MRVKSALQPTLFDHEQPSVMECSGPELCALLASLRNRGCIVLGMTSICVSRWRLSLDWPDTTSGAKP